MKLHILTKIRITAIILLAIVISWAINSRFQFNNCGTPINIVFSGSYGAILTYTIAAAAAAAAAFFLGGKNTRYIAPLAGPFVLALPAVYSDNLNNLLVANQGQAARSHMFKLMFVDAILWYIPILVSLAVVVILGKMVKKKEQQVSEIADKVKFDVTFPKCATATFATSLIAIIILPYLCKGDLSYLSSAGSTIVLSTAVSIGQQAFAVTAAFFLAVMASHQYFRTTGKAYLPVPIIVAGYFYLFGGSSIWDSLASIGVSPVLVPPKNTAQTVLPITFMVFGSLGIAWGYWNSYKIHFARIHNLIKVK